jgi:uridylate kinase
MRTIVMSLGGSIIVPDQIDVEFLKKFRKVIFNFVSKGNKVIIITGGGRTCRIYNSAAEKIVKPSDTDLDWIGIAATKLNAEFVRVIFGKYAYKEIVPDYNIKGIKSKIIIGSGHLPGSSSDLDAVMWAKNYKADYVINFSNTDYIYDKDPNKFKDAKKLEKLDWKLMQKLVGTKWKAGANFPFDPVATKLCKKLRLKLVFMNGRNIKNIDNFLKGKKFKGSIVE